MSVIGNLQHQPVAENPAGVRVALAINNSCSSHCLLCKSSTQQFVTQPPAGGFDLLDNTGVVKAAAIW
jgi:hypothetical protein